jgi:hypothetical protein
MLPPAALAMAGMSFQREMIEMIAAKHARDKEIDEL